ncbi:MAG: Cof-type HAD-IIB family hydrolase [Caldicoprobacterales bacterium]|nr:HAD family phosphatase [Clostridiales bacterium]
MKYKLIAIDLDDTLLNTNLKISELNKKAILDAKRKGVYITIATGRMLNSAMPYIQELNIDIPVITYQGSYLTDVKTGKNIIKKAVPLDYANAIIEECKLENLHIQAYHDTTYFFEVENKYSQFYEKMSGVQGEEVGDLVRYLKYELKEEPVKLIIIDEPPKIHNAFKHFQEKFGKHLQVLISRPHYLEFTHIEATKGNALAQLGSILNIPREEIIAIGDSFNDISMIEYAGLGVAIGNSACQVKSHAQYIAPTNDEDGVADVIYRFIFGEE